LYGQSKLGEAKFTSRGTLLLTVPLLLHTYVDKCMKYIHLAKGIRRASSYWEDGKDLIFV